MCKKLSLFYRLWLEKWQTPGKNTNTEYHEERLLINLFASEEKEWYTQQFMI